MHPDNYRRTDADGRPVLVDIRENGVVVRVGDATAEVARTGGDAARPGIPIGTRNTAELRFALGGTPHSLSAPAGRLTRRSYRIRFHHAGTEFTFIPVSDHESALRRDRIELGRYSVDDSGRIAVDREEDHAVTAVESAAGFALAVAFGCGALHGVEVAIETAVNAVTH